MSDSGRVRIEPARTKSVEGVARATMIQRGRSRHAKTTRQAEKSRLLSIVLKYPRAT